MRNQSLISNLLFDCIGQATSPHNQVESSSKNPQTHPEASSSQLLKESGEGRVELTSQFQTQPPPVHILCTFFSNSQIVEAFGFEVASRQATLVLNLFCRPRLSGGSWHCVFAVLIVSIQLCLSLWQNRTIIPKHTLRHHCRRTGRGTHQIKFW